MQKLSIFDRFQETEKILAKYIQTIESEYMDKIISKFVKVELYRSDNTSSHPHLNN